ncbi:MAG: rRNA adenine N-6-methyltransferase family protein, partial [Candidatus Omnitrophica bacterium]|nr:rRNA adenine N-6-methyltransferase family protein [Candidatus Omnitrophota bacterium]
MRSKPKKYLGQVFLSNPDILNKIIIAAGVAPGDSVLEIGSGRGELTRKIASLAKKLVAVELDRDL